MAIQDEIPKSRLTLTYKTEIEGEPEDINLPLRLVILGDMSGGTSKDRKVDLEERRLRSLNGRNTDAVMANMGMSLEFSVPNKVDPDKADELELKLPIRKMSSFDPDEVAIHIPKVRGLLLLKQLLLEAESNLANKKEFRQLLMDLYGNEGAYKKLLEELKDFEGFKLPAGMPAAE